MTKFNDLTPSAAARGILHCSRALKFTSQGFEEE
jgi:hypothetical protein